MFNQFGARARGTTKISGYLFPHELDRLIERSTDPLEQGQEEPGPPKKDTQPDQLLDKWDAKLGLAEMLARFRGDEIDADRNRNYWREVYARVNADALFDQFAAGTTACSLTASEYMKFLDAVGAPKGIGDEHKTTYSDNPPKLCAWLRKEQTYLAKRVKGAKQCTCRSCAGERANAEDRAEWVDTKKRAAQLLANAPDPPAAKKRACIASADACARPIAKTADRKAASSSVAKRVTKAMDIVMICRPAFKKLYYTVDGSPANVSPRCLLTDLVHAAGGEARNRRVS